jgi:hypothetical protein
MKCATVPFSPVAKYNRLDARFHVALVGGRLEALKRQYCDQVTGQPMTADQALAILADLRLVEKVPVLALSRDNAPRLTDAAVDRACKEYPDLALALVQQAIPPAIERVREQIAQDRAYLDRLVNLAASGPAPEAVEDDVNPKP